MNLTHLVVQGKQAMVRICVLAMFAMFATVSYAQSGLPNLVSASTAVTILQPHYNTVVADFNALNEKSADYAFQSARLEFTLGVYEDVQLGIEPSASILARLDASVAASSSANGNNSTVQYADAVPARASGNPRSGGLQSANAATLNLSNPIVSEIIVLLTQ